MKLPDLNCALASFSKHKIRKGEITIMRQLSYTNWTGGRRSVGKRLCPQYSRSVRAFLRSVKFRENGILINGQRVTTRGVLHAGDSLVFNMPNDRTQKVVPAEGPVSIVFENEDIVLVNKPAGLVIHPCHGHYSDTLLSYLAWYYRLLPGQPLLWSLGRLDKVTSGLILIAKNKYAAQQLERQRANHTLSRVYLALAEGHWQTSPNRAWSTGLLKKSRNVLTATRLLIPDVPQEQNMKFYQNLPMKKHPFPLSA